MTQEQSVHIDPESDAPRVGRVAPTPRRLVVEMEIEVSEGPRLRRGTREDDLKQWVKPLLKATRDHTAELGLVPSGIDYRVRWGYAWMDAAGTISYEE